MILILTEMLTFFIIIYTIYAYDLIFNCGVGNLFNFYFSKIYASAKNIKKYWNYRKYFTDANVKDYILLHVRQLFSHHFDSGKFTKNGNIATIVYYEDSKRFVINFPCSRSPIIYEKVFALKDPINTLQEFTEINSVDVLQEFIGFLGAGKNFHGIPTTPELLEWKHGLKVKLIADNNLYFIPPNDRIPYKKEDFIQNNYSYLKN